MSSLVGKRDRAWWARLGEGTWELACRLTDNSRPRLGIWENGQDPELTRGSGTAKQAHPLYKEMSMKHRCPMPLEPK